MQSNKGHMNLSRFWMKGALVVLLVALAIGMWSLPAQAAKQVVSKVDISDSAGSAQIRVTGSAPLAIHAGRIGTRYVVFDVYGYLNANQKKRVSINNGGIRFINCGWYKDSPPIARIVVATETLTQYSVSYQQNKRLAIITVNKSNSAHKPPPMAVKQASPAPSPVASEACAAPDPIFQSKPVLVASASLILPRADPQPKLVSLDFVASDIHDVLKALSSQGGVNIVASSDVKGEVTASLDRVSVDEALKLVVNLSGYRYEQRDGAYVVGTAANLQALSASGEPAEERSTAVVVIRYGDPVLITKMLESQYNMVNVTSNTVDAKAGTAQSQSVLVLSGAAGSVQSAKAMVEAIENSMAATMTRSVMELYEVKYADINELQGLLGSMIRGLQVTVGPNQGFKLQSPNAVAMGSQSTLAASSAVPAAAQTAQPKTLILQGTQEEIDRAKEFLAKVDVPQPQIIIEAKVIDISDDASKDLGIEWGNQGIVGKPIFTESAPNQALSVGRFSRTGIDVTATILALVENNKGKILANPNVLALDGKPASVFIGDEVKYVIRVDKSLQGTSITTETARVGVQLHTISRVSPDGYITMDLHPEVSVIKSFLNAGEGILLPQISRRFIDSTVRVKDGETIVIGGLIKDDDLKTMKSVPLLGDLPIIGELFRSRSTSKIHSEVMMFITPRIVAGS